MEKSNVFKMKHRRKNSGDTNDEESDGAEEVEVTQCRRGAFSEGSLEVREGPVKTEKIPKDKRSRDSLSRVFNTNLFFSHLDREERSQISDALVQETAQAGDLIIR